MVKNNIIILTIDKTKLKVEVVQAVDNIKADIDKCFPANELSESANLIQIANRIKREIHGIVDKTNQDGSNR